MSAWRLACTVVVGVLSMPLRLAVSEWQSSLMEKKDLPREPLRDCFIRWKLSMRMSVRISSIVMEAAIVIISLLFFAAICIVLVVCWLFECCFSGCVV